MILGNSDTECCACGIKFSVPTHWLDARRQDKTTFYCPNGHQLSYNESELDKLRRENQRMKQDAAYKDDRIKDLKEYAEKEKRTAIAYRGQCTKLKKRAKAGVCPCCNRMFMDMQAHMATKHPKFDPEEPIKLVTDNATKGSVK